LFSRCIGNVEGVAYVLMGRLGRNWPLYIAIYEFSIMYTSAQSHRFTFTQSLKSGRRSPREACAAVARHIAAMSAEALHRKVLRWRIVYWIECAPETSRTRGVMGKLSPNSRSGVHTPRIFGVETRSVCSLAGGLLNRSTRSTAILLYEMG
jgi:hypothetical protein